MFTSGQPVFLEALGWALLNSLWYFGLLWLFYNVYLFFRPKLSSSARHWLALVLLFTGFAGFTISLFSLFINPAGSLLPYFSFKNENYAVSYSFIRNLLQEGLPWFSLLYLLMVVILSVRFGRIFYHSHKVLNTGLIDIPRDVAVQVQVLLQKLDISKEVSVWISAHVDTPMIIGFFKPVILLPVACLNQLPISQVEAILLHELSHIKRNDYLVNLFVAACEIIFFFNPFAWFFFNTIKRERENCCDDQVIALQNDPLQYATALMTLEKNRAALFTVALAATGKNKHMLLSRIRRILKLEPVEKGNSGLQYLAAFLTIAFVSVAAYMIPDEVHKEKLRERVILQEKGGVKDVVKVDVDVTIPEVIVENIVLSGVAEHPETPAYPDDSADSVSDSGIPVTPVEFKEETAKLNMAVYEEQRDFTIPEAIDPLLPPTVTIPNTYPYVPNSSFSFYRMNDSLKQEIVHKYMLEKIALEKAVMAEKLSTILAERSYLEEQEIIKADSLRIELENIRLLKKAEKSEQKNNKEPRIIIRKKTVIVYI